MKQQQIMALKDVSLVCTKSTNYNQLNSKILGDLTKNKNAVGLYISLNKSAESVENNLKKNNINTSKICFIAAVSGKSKSKKNCIFVNGVKSLTEISLAIALATNTGKYSYVYFDNISTLLSYHSAKETERFVHYLVGKLRHAEVTGILVLIDSPESNKLMPIISSFCDDCVMM